MEWDGARALITGGDGFIGLHLSAKLEKAGASVTIASKNKHGGKNFVNIDVTKADSLKFEGYDYVFHLAGIADPRICDEKPEEAFLVNSYGTLNVLEACRRDGIGRVLFSSSAHVYGIPRYNPIDEGHPLRPVSTYGRSKVAAEHVCKAYGATVLRFFNIYGPGQMGDYLVPTILQGITRDCIELRNLDSKRDFVYVDDAVEAMLLAADFPNECFNVGSGNGSSPKEIFEMLCKISGRTPELKSLNKPDIVPNLVADISKAEKLLGWEPKVGLEEGLRKSNEVLE